VGDIVQKSWPDNDVVQDERMLLRGDGQEVPANERYEHNESIDISAMDICVIPFDLNHPTAYYSFPMKLLEYLALEKPVITYVSNELYETYKPPIYRTTKDTFQNDLVNLLEDEKSQKKLAIEGKTYVSNIHAVEKVVDMIERYYREF